MSENDPRAGGHKRYSAHRAASQDRLDHIDDGTIDLVDLAERVAFIAPKVGPLRGDRVIRVDPKDRIAVSKARAAIADRYAAMSRRRYGSRPASTAIHWMAAKRINELERYLDHRYGHFVPDDDAGRGDLMILANHVGQNRRDPRAKILGCIRRWAPWMEATEAEALADKVLKKPRKYKAKTLGGLLRLTNEEQITLYIETIRPFDKTDADMEENKKRRDRDSKAANRAANRSGRPRGRPKSEGAKPWEPLGISKATYYRRQKVAKSGTNGETKNASAVLEYPSYSADRFSVSRPQRVILSRGLSVPLPS
jgi:hypothetical protein